MRQRARASDGAVRAPTSHAEDACSRQGCSGGGQRRIGFAQGRSCRMRYYPLRRMLMTCGCSFAGSAAGIKAFFSSSGRIGRNASIPFAGWSYKAINRRLPCLVQTVMELLSARSRLLLDLSLHKARTKLSRLEEADTVLRIRNLQVS